MRKLCWFVFGWAAAAAACAYLPLPRTWLAGLGAGLVLVWLVLCLLRVSNLRFRRALCVVLGLGLGFAWCFVYQILWYDAARLAAEEGTGTRTFLVTDNIRETRYGASVYGRLQGGAAPVKTLVYLDEYDENLLPGDLVTGSFSLRLSEESSDYYDSIGVLLIASQRGEVTMRPGNTGRLLYLPKRIARYLGREIDQVFPRTQAGLVKALLIGDRTGMDYAFSNDLKLTGIYHAVAISGLHVNLLATLLYLASGKHRRRYALITGPVLLVFAAVTGGSPSVCRAVVMQLALLSAPLAGREHDAPTSLALALLLLLLPNPMAARHVGLQLSVASVAGLLLYADGVERAVEASGLMQRLAQKSQAAALCVKFLAASGGASAGALVFSLPLTALYFGTVPLISPVSNLLGLWAVEAAFVLGGVTVLTGLVSLSAAKTLAFLPGLCVDYLRGLAGLLAKLPFSCLFTNTAYVWIWLGLLYAVVLVCRLFGRPRHLLRTACLLALALCLAVTGPVIQSRRANYELRVLDVGQGQCILLTSGSTSALIDCGGSYENEAGELAARMCRTKGEFSLDLLILTHYDSDHCNGIFQLLNRMRVKTVCLPDSDAGSETRERIEAAAREAGSEIVYLSEDTQAAFGKGYLRLFPPERIQDHNSSMAVLASFGEVDLLVTGDMDQAEEEALLGRYEFPTVEILVAGHHGSRYATGEALLSAIRPRIVLISVGRNNYGHPAEETLTRIASCGAVCRRTDQMGELVLRG